MVNIQDFCEEGSGPGSIPAETANFKEHHWVGQTAASEHPIRCMTHMHIHSKPGSKFQVRKLGPLLGRDLVATSWTGVPEAWRML